MSVEFLPESSKEFLSGHFSNVVGENLRDSFRCSSFIFCPGDLRGISIRVSTGAMPIISTRLPQKHYSMSSYKLSAVGFSLDFFSKYSPGNFRELSLRFYRDFHRSFSWIFLSS